MNKCYKPYTYAIGWSKQNIWYYGVRFSKKSYVGDIWINYFTSSSIVNEFVNDYGDPDIIKVMKVFETVDEAIAHEHKFLKRVKVNTNPRFLNAHCAPVFGGFEDKNPMKNDKTKQKMRRTRILQNFIVFLKNKKFIPHPKKISVLNKYLLILENRIKKYPRIKKLIEKRISLCKEWKPKQYPKNRNSSKRGSIPKISESKKGKKAYYDPITKVCRMFALDELPPDGWVKGLIKNTPNTNTPEVRKKISEALTKSRNQESEEKKKQRVEKWKKTRATSNEI